MSSFRVWGIELPLGSSGDEALKRAVAKSLFLHIDSIEEIRVARRSLDARKGRREPRYLQLLGLRTVEEEVGG